MAYIIRNKSGDVLGILPDSLRVVTEVRSSAGERSSTIAAGTEWDVPEYIVGKAQLEVFVDGLACMAGSQYAEVGNADEQSAKIVWNFDLPTDMDVIIRQVTILDTTGATIEEIRSLGGERANAIASGTEFTVPPYLVGSGRLEIFVDGVACMKGEQYEESGPIGSGSETIVWLMNIATDRDILIRSK